MATRDRAGTTPLSADGAPRARGRRRAPQLTSPDNFAEGGWEWE